MSTTPPERRQSNGYQELAKFRSQVRRAFIVVFGVILVHLAFSVVGWTRTNAAAESAANAAAAASELAEQVQASRVEAISQECRDVNQRHDATINTLDTLLADRLATATPMQAERLHESRAFTVLLIDALVPKRDCDARTADLTELPKVD